MRLLKGAFMFSVLVYATSSLAYYKWVGPRCIQYTSTHQIVGWVSDSYCEEESPPIYRWVGGRCIAFTSFGQIIGGVSNSRCE